jgi:hypothetical protein
MRSPALVLLLAFSLAVSFVPQPASPATGSQAAHTELELVRARIVGYYTGAGAVANDPRLRASLEGTASHAGELAREGFLLSDGRWSDLDYAAIPSGVWSPWDHFRRLTVLAKAWAIPGQPLYRDARLLAKIESAIAAIPSFYGRQIRSNGNWWFWTIGPALDLGPTLVLVGDAIDPQIREAALAVLADRIGAAPGLTASYSLLSGQNLVWSAINHTMLAVLRNDAARLTQARDRIASAALPSPGRDGIQNDYSFHQHGPQLYTGGYGSAFAYEASKFVLFTDGTSFALPAASRDSISRFVAESLRWSLAHNYFDPSTISREAARPHANGFNGLASLIHLSSTNDARRDAIAGSAAEMLRTWTQTLPPELAAIASGLRDRAASPSGHRHFPDSDYTIVRRPGWFASIKMFSARTKSGERTNGENLLGSRQSDGRMHLVLNGDEYADGAMAALDWSRLPGITVERKAGAANDLYGFGTESFVGGTGNGRAGVSAMRLAPLGSQLTARKAWFFFDDAIVGTVSGVSSLGGNRIETVVDQRVATTPLSRGRASGLEWIVADGIGYALLDGTATVEESRRTASWKSLAETNPDITVDKAVRTIAIDHGAYVANERAGYLILPRTTAAGMTSWLAQQPVRLLANDASVAAVRDLRNGDTAIVFWNAGSFDGITVDKPCVVFRSGSHQRMTLAIADPSRSTGTMRVTVDGAWRITASDFATTSVTTSSRSTSWVISRDGRTNLIALEAAPEPRRRTTRR